jgi:hypothetical protein
MFEQREEVGAATGTLDPVINGNPNVVIRESLDGTKGVGAARPHDPPSLLPSRSFSSVAMA